MKVMGWPQLILVMACPFRRWKRLHGIVGSSSLSDLISIKGKMRWNVSLQKRSELLYFKEIQNEKFLMMTKNFYIAALSLYAGVPFRKIGKRYARPS